MTSFPSQLAQLAAAVPSTLVETHDAAPELLAFGEPTHGEPAFPDLRNRIFEVLVDRGFRSIALESDAVAALEVDAFVRGERGTLDAALAGGFSHGFGQLEANRELVAWMRTRNDSLPAAQRLSFYGFDAPLEASHAQSPRRCLEHLHGYLVEHLGSGSLRHAREELDQLLGDDQPWSDPAAQMNAEKSIGASKEAAALRVIADDLMTTLHVQAPRLVAASSLAAWHSAEVHGRAALGLLRYHAQAAEPAPQTERVSRLLGVRDALMAQNLLAIRAREHHRGPTLVFAHNRHLQRHPSRWRLAEMDLEWSSAGAIIATLLGERYAFVVGSLGASATLGLEPPASDTFEGALEEATEESALVDAAQLSAVLGHAGRNLHVRTDVTPEQGYSPLDTATLEHCDAILHIASAPGDHRFEGTALTAADIAARIILTFPDITHLRADEKSGAPEINWGDWFFYAKADHRMPFATIVGRDIPGFDEDSRLDRPDVFRLNIGVGREEFEREFGFPPAELADRRASIDFAKLNAVIPHPAYGVQGWACILNPTTRRLADIDRLLARAYHRALDRSNRKAHQHP